MSAFGTLLKVSTFGESHCRGVGCIIEGVPPRMLLDESHIQSQLTRRRPGQSRLTTARNEKDRVMILSGVEHGLTLGTPIALFVRNKDQRPHDYTEMADIPRPSHADFTYQKKYGIRASSGGGRSSARETVGRVAAGAIAEKWLAEKYSVSTVAWVSRVGAISAPESLELRNITRAQVDESLVRCPHPESSSQMIDLIDHCREENDSLGGVVTCIVDNCPIGLGEPCFNKLEAKIAHAMLSIPATKGFEIGSGFEGTKLRGSQHNDMFTPKNDDLGTVTNNSGGIQGGISNGERIIIRVAFKPAATIAHSQVTSDFEGNLCTLAAKGRHDPCILSRAVPIVESMIALVIADAALIQESRISASLMYPVLNKVTPESHILVSEYMNSHNTIPYKPHGFIPHNTEDQKNISQSIPDF